MHELEAALKEKIAVCAKQGMFAKPDGVTVVAFDAAAATKKKGKKGAKAAENDADGARVQEMQP